MAEEHRCEAPETHRLCANNCGFFGSPATLDLCSKCYRDHRLKEEQESSAKFAVEKSLAGTTTLIRSSPSVTIPVTNDGQRSEVSIIKTTESSSSSSDLPQRDEISTKPSRCSTCRKRVGLTGFQCRCGITFCSMHRYPEQHGCSFDFKSVGRDAIAKANPVVIAEKLQKI